MGLNPGDAFIQESFKPENEKFAKGRYASHRAPKKGVR
jgi:hypothetical protein